MTVMCLSQLQSQEEGNTRLCQIKDSLHSVRSQMKAELDSGVRELESPSSVSSDTDSLKENHPSVMFSLGNPAYNTKVSLFTSVLVWEMCTDCAQITLKQWFSIRRPGPTRGPQHISRGPHDELNDLK